MGCQSRRQPSWAAAQRSCRGGDRASLALCWGRWAQGGASTEAGAAGVCSALGLHHFTPASSHSRAQEHLVDKETEAQGLREVAQVH